MGYRLVNADGEVMSITVLECVAASVPNAVGFISNAIMHGNTSWDKVSEYVLGFLLDEVNFHGSVGKIAKTEALLQLMEKYSALFGLIDELRDLGSSIEVKYKVVYDTKSGIKTAEIWASNSYDIRRRLPGNWTNIIAKEVIMG
jgi:hypothetical protein